MKILTDINTCSKLIIDTVVGRCIKDSYSWGIEELLLIHETVLIIVNCNINTTLLGFLIISKLLFFVAYGKVCFCSCMMVLCDEQNKRVIVYLLIWLLYTTLRVVHKLSIKKEISVTEKSTDDNTDVSITRNVTYETSFFSSQKKNEKILSNLENKGFILCTNCYTKKNLCYQKRVLLI